MRLTANLPVSHIVDERTFRLEEPIALFLGPDEPFQGDLVTVHGRRIVDCGHCPYRAEIHPPDLVIVERSLVYFPIFSNTGDPQFRATDRERAPRPQPTSRMIESRRTGQTACPPPRRKS